MSSQQTSVSHNKQQNLAAYIRAINHSSFIRGYTILAYIKLKISHVGHIMLLKGDKSDKKKNKQLMPKRSQMHLLLFKRSHLEELLNSV